MIATRAQGVGPPEEAARALLYGGNGRIREEFLFDACDFEVVQEIGLHVLEGDAGPMALGHDPGGQGQGGSVYEEVGEVVLAGQDDGQDWLGVSLKLSDGMQIGQDLKPEEGGFIDDEDGLLLAVLGGLQDLLSYELSEDGPGEAGVVPFEFDADLPVEFQGGALRGGDPDDLILGWVQPAGGPAQSGGLPTAHISGD